MAIKLLDNFMSPITGRILCDSGMILAGDENGVAVPSNNMPISMLPDIAFVLNNGSEDTRLELTNAQFIKDLGEGIVKITDNGLFTLAIVGTDYGDLTVFNQIIKNAADSAAASAGSAGTSSTNLDIVNVIKTEILRLAEICAGEKTIASAALTAAVIDAAAVTYYLSEASISVRALASAKTIVDDSFAYKDKLHTLTGHITKNMNTAYAAYKNAEQYVTDIKAVKLNDLVNEGNIDMEGYRITNLKQTPVESQDAVSLKFLWDYIHDGE